MTRVSKNFLLMGVAMFALAACASEKGPGTIGTKNDIVVRNNGMPGGAQAQAAGAPAKDGDFSSTVEQAQAVPAPSVDSGESLPESTPAMDQAVQAVQDAKAPLPSTATAPGNDGTASSTAPITEAKPIDNVAPTEPVADTVSTQPPTDANAQVTPAPAQRTTFSPAIAPPTGPATTQAAAPRSSVYPASDYPAQPAIPPDTTTSAPLPAQAAPVAAPAPAQPAKPYVMDDPNAPYSPKAAAGAGGAASAGTTASSPASAVSPESGAAGLSDPDVIRSAQAALKAKGAYNGAETGTVDAGFLNALSIYQGQNKLPQGGLNTETLRHLGVIR